MSENNDASPKFSNVDGDGTSKNLDRLKRRKAVWGDKLPLPSTVSFSETEAGVEISPPLSVVPENEAGAEIRPHLDMSLTVSDLATKTGRILRENGLFAMNDCVVTVRESAVRSELMTSACFVSWAEQFIDFGKFDSAENFRKVSISESLASKILAAHQFRGELKKIEAIHDVPLPTWANDEKTKIRLLPVGYDEGTGVFTTDALSYDTGMSADEARGVLCDLYANFPFEGDSDLMANRSFAVQLTAHLAAYCRVMMAGKLRPGFVYLANQAGSGKTLLTRLALGPVFGAVSIESLAKSDDERGKQLTTLVAEQRGYAFYDNVKGYLESQQLEGFLTSPSFTGRILGKSESVTGENTALIFISGNQLTLSQDLLRRVLVVELFCAQEAVTRNFDSPLTDSWPTNPENRKRVLAALFSLLKHWEESGAVRLSERLLPSFEDFSGLIGGIVANAGFANPLAAPKTGMDETEQAWKLLLSEAAASISAGLHREFTVDELLEIADRLNVSDILTAGARDIHKAFGHRIKKWKGRVLGDAKGRSFEFGKRSDRAGAAYSIRVYTEAESKAL